MLDSLLLRVLYSPGALQAWILEWGASPFSRGSSQPRDRTQVSCNEGRFFSSWATRGALEIVNLNGMQVHAHLRHSMRGSGVAMTGCSWAVSPCAEDTAQNRCALLAITGPPCCNKNIFLFTENSSVWSAVEFSISGVFICVFYGQTKIY